MTDDNHLYMVFTNPIEGQEELFNDWYEREHIHEVLALDGFVGVRRYRLNDAQRAGQAPPPFRYLTVYEVEGDPAAAHAAVARAGRSRRLGVQEEHVAWVYSPLGERLAAEDSPGPIRVPMPEGVGAGE